MKTRIFLLAFVSSIVYGQGFEVTKGPAIPQIEMDKLLNIPAFQFSYTKALLTSDVSTTFFNVKARKSYTGYGYSGNEFQIGVWDDYIKFNSIKKLGAEFVESGQKVSARINSFVSINDKQFVFYSMDFPERDEVSFYVNELSEDMVLLGSPILIQNYKGLRQYGYQVSVTQSRNKKLFMVTRVLSTRFREHQKLECKVISDSFSEIWKREFELEHQDKNVRLVVDRIDDTGNYYLLGEIPTGKDESRPVLFTYFWKKGSLKTFDLGMKEGVNFGSNMEIRDDVMMIAGLNRQKRDITYFVNRLYVNAEVMELLGSHPMPEGFFKASNWNFYETSFWGVDRIIPLDNNVWVSSIEAKLLIQGTYISTLGAYLEAFGEDGMPKWSHAIYKLQGGDRSIVGVRLLPVGNKLIAFYNDEPENLTRGVNDDGVRDFDPGRATMPVVQEIDEKGNAKKYSFFADKDMQNSWMDILNLRKIDNELYFAPIHSTSKKKNEVDQYRNIVFRIK